MRHIAEGHPHELVTGVAKHVGERVVDLDVLALRSHPDDADQRALKSCAKQSLVQQRLVLRPPLVADIMGGRQPGPRRTTRLLPHAHGPLHRGRIFGHDDEHRLKRPIP